MARHARPASRVTLAWTGWHEAGLPVGRRHVAHPCRRHEEPRGPAGGERAHARARAHPQRACAAPAGVFELYGLPYDVGAVPTHLWEPTLVSGGIAAVAAVGVTAGLWFGLAKVFEQK